MGLPRPCSSASRCGNKPRGFSILLYAYIVTAHFTRLIWLIHKIDRGKQGGRGKEPHALRRICAPPDMCTLRTPPYPHPPLPWVQ